MPPLANAKHEIFCQHLAKGKTQKDAAIQAGYSAKTAEAAASRLLSKVKELQTRVTEIKSQSAEKACIDRAYVLREAVRTYERCVEGKKFLAKAAISALHLIADHKDVDALASGRITEGPTTIIVNADQIQIAQVLNKDELTELRERFRIRANQDGGVADPGGSRPDHPVAGHA